MTPLPESMPCLEFRGQGVFAGRDIKKGELLERSPVIPVPAGEWTLVSQTVLRHYCYAWGKNHKDAALALGRGSLFSNSPGEPAAYYVNHLRDMVMVFFAARDITQGEEITVNRRKPGQAG